MSDFRTQEAGSTLPRAFTMIDKSSGSPLTGSSTVYYYLKNITGANAGKWWRDSDQTWQVSETANAMTHQADGHWTRTLAASPWTNGEVSLEYAKDSGDAHVPVSRMLAISYTPSANSARAVSVNTTDIDTIANNVLDIANGVETSLTLRQAIRLIVAASSGKISGASTATITIRNIGDSKNRIVATVDAYGNRSAITTDLT
jgi:hypothetical protein